MIADGGSRGMGLCAAVIVTAARGVRTGGKDKRKGKNTKKKRNYARLGTLFAGGGGGKLILTFRRFDNQLCRLLDWKFHPPTIFYA
jgi:hypothetical protein